MVLVAAAAACRTPATSAPAVADAASFVATLGVDTVSVETFVRSDRRIEGAILRRVPRTSVMRYAVTLGANGLPTRLEYNTRLPNGDLLANGARGIVVTFTPDSVITQRDSVVIRRVAARGAYPELDGSMALFALPIAALEAAGGDSAVVLAYAPGAARADSMPIARRGPGRYWLYSFGSPTEILTDAAGVQAVDGSRTTLRIMSRRQGAIDISRLAATFAEREGVTGPMTALSTRDSVVTSIAGAAVSIGYGRPAARGRKVWGPNGVLGDTIWRTGANASTKFTISSPVAVAGQILSAGTYQLTTLAIPGRYHLIFSQNGAERLRAPLETRDLSPPVERFTILVDPAGERAATLRLQWDTLELSLPIAISSP